MAPAAFRYNWEHSAFLCASLQDLLRKSTQKPRFAVTVTANFSFRIFSIKIWCMYSRKPTVQWSEVTCCSRIWSNGSSQGRNYTDVFFNKSCIFEGGFCLVGWGCFYPRLFQWPYSYHCLSECCTGPAEGMTQRKGKEQHQLEASQINFEMRTFPQGVVLCETAFKTCWRREVCFPILSSTHRNS